MVVVIYFAYLAVLALVMPAPRPRKLRVLAVSTATIAAASLVGMPHIVPLAYLLVGYWLPAYLVSSPNRQVESRLIGFDRWLMGEWGMHAFRRAPFAVRQYFELSYLLCYAVPLAGYLWLAAAGFSDATTFFWEVVLSASFLCYGLLPLIPSRAPRIVEAVQASSSAGVRQLNLAILTHASVQWNTFPSGHTAASVATALAVAPYVPVAGVVIGLVAASIAAGSVIGRYHYAADAIAGVLVAIVAFVTATAAHAP